MSKEIKNEKLFASKLFYTLLIMALYCVGRSIPLYGVDLDAYAERTLDVHTILNQSIRGDTTGYSIMTLGIMPYFLASIINQIIQAINNIGRKKKVSPKKINRFQLVVMVLLCLITSFQNVQKLVLLEDGFMPLFIIKTVDVIEMITGAFVVLWLCRRNKIYGIGGQTAIIVVNIIEGIMKNLFSGNIESIIIPIVLGLIMAYTMIYMENGEKRLPVQRISIHNIYADKNYQSIKFNPIGIMPIMFATAFFMLPQMVVEALYINFPTSERLAWVNNNLTLQNDLGIIVYIVIIYFLNILFSLLTINPNDMTEQFLKSGDSIVNIHPGKKTKRYIMWNVILMAFISSTIMSACAATCLLLQMNNTITGSLAALPMSLMMLTGIWCRLYEEARAIISSDSYKVFI